MKHSEVSDQYCFLYSCVFMSCIEVLWEFSLLKVAN